MAHRQPDRERGLQQRPVFVLCPPRSCSTIVTVLLGGHPGLFAVPELRLFRADRIGGILADRLRLAGLVRALAQVHDGDQSEASVAAAYDWLTERAEWPGVAVMDHLQQLVAPLTLVEKSPENTSRDVYLRRFARAYPQARYLHLVRHPQASVTSLLDYWQPPREWRLPRTMQHQFGCSFWLFQHRRIERFLRATPDSRSRRVIAEAVLVDPQARLPELAEWLGESTAAAPIESMLRTQAWAFASPGPESAVGGGDAGFFASPQLRGSRMPTGPDLPQEWLIDPWTRLACMEAATRYGYAATSVSGPVTGS